MSPSGCRVPSVQILTCTVFACFREQVNIDDGFLNLMTQDGASKDDVKVPEGDIGKQIQADFDEGKDLLVTIVSAMGEEQAISYKEAPKGS